MGVENLDKNHCVFCVATLHGSGYEMRHMASNHIQAIKREILNSWQVSCPVCGCILYDERNRAAHIENHKKIDVVMALFELRFTARPFDERTPVKPKSNQWGLDKCFKTKSNLDEFFW